MVRVTPILQICYVVVVLKQRLASFQHLRQFFAVSTFLILRSPSWTLFLYPEAPRVNVFRSLSCSHSIRQRIRRRTVTLYLQSSLEFPNLGT